MKTLLIGIFLSFSTFVWAEKDLCEGDCGPGDSLERMGSGRPLTAVEIETAPLRDFEESQKQNRAPASEESEHDYGEEP